MLLQEATEQALEERETKRAEAAAALERRMAAMEAAMAARRTPIAEAQPVAARGPGAELRFEVKLLTSHPSLAGFITSFQLLKQCDVSLPLAQIVCSSLPCNEAQCLLLI